MRVSKGHTEDAWHLLRVQWMASIFFFNVVLGL